MIGAFGGLGSTGINGAFRYFMVVDRSPATRFNEMIVLVLTQVRMMEERLVKGEYCLSTSGVGSPPHSLPSTFGTQNDKIEDVHCACISKLETQVEEQVRREPVLFVFSLRPRCVTGTVTVFPLQIARVRQRFRGTRAISVAPISGFAISRSVSLSRD